MGIGEFPSWLKQPEHVANYKYVSIAQCRNAWNITCTSHTILLSSRTYTNIGNISVKTHHSYALVYIHTTAEEFSFLFKLYGH